MKDKLYIMLAVITNSLVVISKPNGISQAVRLVFSSALQRLILFFLQYFAL